MNKHKVVFLTNVLSALHAIANNTAPELVTRLQKLGNRNMALQFTVLGNELTGIKQRRGLGQSKQIQWKLGLQPTH